MSDFDDVVLSHHPDAVFVLDRDGTVLHWNDAAHRLFGYAPADAVGRAWLELLGSPAQEAAFSALLERAGRERSVVDESVLQCRDGSRLHASGSIAAVRDRKGTVTGFVVTKKDVTSLKLQRDTKLVEAKFRDMLEHTPDAMLIVNVTGHIVLLNAQAEELFRRPRRDLIGRPVERLMPERYREQHRTHRASFHDNPRTRTMGAGLELFAVRGDGTEFPAEVSLSPVETEEGRMVMCAVRDLTERRRARQRAERMFRDLLESAPDAMVIVDETGRIVLVNSQTVALFGWQREELLGEPVETLIPHRFRGQHPGHRAGFFAQPKVRQMGAGLDLFGLRKNNTEFPVEISLSPIQTEDGLLVASAIRDATERRRAEQLLQEANRLKSEFLANMSHELRTPLNGILGFSELLVDQRAGALNDKQREYLTDIHECGKHLLQLINDVLDLSKVEAGRMELWPETFSPSTAVSAVCALVGPIARKKRIRLTPAPDMSVTPVTLDLQKFKQILFNLLSNAVKFTDPGGQVDVLLEEQDASQLCLKVRDNGIGIAPGDMSRLFEAFRQLDGGPSRQYGGTGLGLALTRRLVELHGGTVHVDSVQGEGSTFTVVLPRRVAATHPG